MGQETIQLSVVIPAYNEAGRIGRLLERLSEYLQVCYGMGSFEIIVVDDGVVRRHDCGRRGIQRAVSLLRLPENRGKGAAVRAGVWRVRRWLADNRLPVHRRRQ